MEFDDYQARARKFAKYPMDMSYQYLALGLNGEAGEVAEKIKKMLRDGIKGEAEEWRRELVKELGDVLWYLSELAQWAGFGLDEVAEQNLAKLESRASRGKIGGSGDNR
jgi:NTP pyrophosphatase (non-canonical NTP hydrolase)